LLRSKAHDSKFDVQTQKLEPNILSAAGVCRRSWRGVAHLRSVELLVCEPCFWTGENSGRPIF